MARHRQYLALLLVLAFLLCGCQSLGGMSQPSAKASAKETAWKTLMAGKQTYDSTFRMLAQAEALGKLPPKAKATAIQLGNLYMQAHNRAVDDLLAGKDPGLAAVQSALDAFLAFAIAYQEKK